MFGNISRGPAMNWATFGGPKTIL